MKSKFSSPTSAAFNQEKSAVRKSVFWLFFTAKLLNLILAAAYPALREAHKTSLFSRPYVPELLIPSILVLFALVIIAFSDEWGSRRSGGRDLLGKLIIIAAGIAQLGFVASRPQAESLPVFDTRLIFLTLLFTLPVITGVAGIILLRREGGSLAPRLTLLVMAAGYAVGVTHLFVSAPLILTTWDYLTQNTLWLGVIQITVAVLQLQSISQFRNYAGKAKEGSDTGDDSLGDLPPSFRRFY